MAGIRGGGECANVGIPIGGGENEAEVLDGGYCGDEVGKAVLGLESGDVLGEREGEDEAAGVEDRDWFRGIQ